MTAIRKHKGSHHEQPPAAPSNAMNRKRKMVNQNTELHSSTERRMAIEDDAGDSFSSNQDGRKQTKESPKPCVDMKFLVTESLRSRYSLLTVVLC
ncbi:hypothetical protein SESBI_18480 [Sesbania bispinosa]|nr:hypothetical protein SESBI_18480 [Sesbania bispinosa]